EPAPQKTFGTISGPTIALAGSLITAGVVALSLAPGWIGLGGPVSTSKEATLSAVPASDIAAAADTLDPATSQQAVADAKSCKAPIAWATLVRQSGGPDGTIRIRSGTYVSPPFRVTSVPKRVAIPYPAPYPTGHGLLTVVGEGTGVSIFINPVWHIPTLNGAASLNVIWTPQNPC